MKQNKISRRAFLTGLGIASSAALLAACGSSGSSAKKDGEVAVFWYTFGDTYLSSVRAMKSHSFAQYFEEYKQQFHL